MLLTYVGTFVVVFAALLLSIEVGSRWMRRGAASDRYLSRRRLSQLRGD